MAEGIELVLRRPLPTSYDHLFTINLCRLAAAATRQALLLTEDVELVLQHASGILQAHQVAAASRLARASASGMKNNRMAFPPSTSLMRPDKRMRTAADYADQVQVLK